MSEHPDRSVTNSNQTPFDSTEWLINRRSAVTLGACLLFGTSGCIRHRTLTEAGHAITPGTVFRNIEFDGTDLLVRLRNNHRIEQLNLIGPSGEAFRTVPVNVGETLARIPILRITPERYQHYPPGNFKLLAINEIEKESLQIDLEPDIRIVDVNQLGDERNRDFGNLRIIVENVGTAPTWIYEVGFQNAPNHIANQIGDNPGSPELYLEVPESTKETIVYPGSSKGFASRISPLIFNDKSSCSGETLKLTVTLRTPIRDITRIIDIKVGGSALQVQRVTLEPKFACEKFDVINLQS